MSRREQIPQKIVDLGIFESVRHVLIFAGKDPSPLGSHPQFSLASSAYGYLGYLHERFATEIAMLFRL